MAVSVAKSQDEIMQLPLVELAWEILKAKKEPFYFRDLMDEIKVLRSMSDTEVLDVIARLYTEINIDGRFVCIGQNIWGLKRWYPVDKTAEKAAGKRFVRSTGDAFSDDDEDLDEELEADYDEEVVIEDEVDQSPLYADEEEVEVEADADAEEFETADEDADFVDEEEGLVEEEPLLDDDGGEDEDEDDHF